MSTTEAFNMSFNSKTVVALTGLTLRQIDHWDRARVVKPSLKVAAGCGSGRLYSFTDLALLKVAKMLTDAGVSLQKTRTMVQYLKKHRSNMEQPATGLQFITDGNAVFILSKDNKVILKSLAKGQMVFAVALGQIIEDLICEVDDVCRDRSQKVSVKRKAYEVVLHPDTEDGGYCVTCPSLLGCDSQGDTEEEALEMIKDAIKGHLAVAAKKKTKRAAA
jgi:predicted RNase H-like HicB family nuclease